MIDHPSGLTVHDLEARRGQRTVLRGVTARFPRARVSAVIGPNGAGKSTLLDVIAGVHPAVAGSVERAGRCLPAYVVQRSEASDTLPITVRAAVAMGRWARRGAWRRLTEQDWTIVDGCIARLGIRDVAGHQLGALSGGQRQRTLVAQGLAQETDLLLLDEPAAGLALQAQQCIDDALEQACAQGVTVLRVTHDLSAAERASHCLVLHDGRVLAQGDPATVLAPDLVAQAWGVPRRR